MSNPSIGPARSAEMALTGKSSREREVLPPVEGMPATRYRSPEEYKRKTGYDFSGDDDITLEWTRALKDAAGQFPWWRLYYANVCGVDAGGISLLASVAQ